MQSLTIVVLNYMNYEETITCVNSVLRQKETKYYIIIVENGSTNESYDILRRTYKNHKLIKVLRIGRNYGFAKGNNIGINYARSRFGADFVLLLNSDVELVDELYLKRMYKAYDSNIGVLGSRIIERDGKEQKRNVGYVHFPDTLLHYLNLVSAYTGMVSLKKMASAKLQHKSQTDILHGCNLLLTPSFFQHYKGLYEKTFLYCEEELLYILCDRAGLKQSKVQDTYLIHKGKQSSKFLFQNKYSIRDKYILSSYRAVIWESFKNKILKGK